MMAYVTYTLIVLLFFNLFVELAKFYFAVFWRPRKRAEDLILGTQNKVFQPFKAVQILIHHFQEIGCLEGETSARTCGQHLFNTKDP